MTTYHSNLVTIPSKYETYSWSSGATNTDPKLVGSSIEVAGRYIDSRTSEALERPKPQGPWLYPTDYTRLIQTFRSGPSEARCWRESTFFGKTTRNYRLYTGNFGEDSARVTSYPPLASDNMRRAAEVAALTKLKDQRINLGVSLAEARMTANFIGETAGKIGRSYKHARKGRFKRAFRELGAHWKETPNHWLAYQYAIRPLVGDVYGAIEALTRSDPSTWVVTVKGSRFDKPTFEETHGSGCMYSRTRVADEIGVFVRLDYLPNNEFLSTLTSAGTTNLAETLWEVVPFSFVVDWFVGIGAWLHVLDATLGYDFLSGSYSMRSKRTCVSKGVSPPPAFDNGWNWDYVKSSATRRMVRFERKRYLNSPMPWLPVVKDPLRLSNLASGISLLTMAFSGKVPPYVRQ